MSSEILVAIISSFGVVAAAIIAAYTGVFGQDIRRRFLWSGSVFDPNCNYMITSKFNDNCIDATMSTENGTQITTWTCHGADWQRWQIRPAPHNHYFLISKHTGKALEVDNWSQYDLARIQLWDYHGGTNQQWEIQLWRDGYYRIRAKHSEKALDVSGERGQNGNILVQFGWHGGDNQLWKIETLPD